MLHVLSGVILIKAPLVVLSGIILKSFCEKVVDRLQLGRKGFFERIRAVSIDHTL